MQPFTFLTKANMQQLELFNEYPSEGDYYDKLKWFIKNHQMKEGKPVKHFDDMEKFEQNHWHQKYTWSISSINPKNLRKKNEA